MRTNDETTRYNSTTPEADEEWMAMFPAGAGGYRLHTLGHNEENRAVFVAMYHEIHCVQLISKSLIKNVKKQWPHIHHCLSYLRQIIMCRPDLTLESGIFEKELYIGRNPGSVHVCQDWRVPYAFLEEDVQIWRNISED